LVEEYYRRFPDLRQRETVVWCFDEILAVPGWETFVRGLLDSEKVEVFLSGSSAARLSREVATPMRGYTWEVVLQPFSIDEALRHAGQTVPERPDALSPRERSALEHSFLTYLTAGGFPAAQGQDAITRDRLLHDYVDIALLRDVVERNGVSHVAAVRALLRHLLGTAGGTFSAQKFYEAQKSQGMSLSKDTVHDALRYLEDSFLIRTLWIEADSERRRMVNPRKAYPIDMGLIPMFDRTGRAHLGHALETAVLIDLERRGTSVTYVKTAEGHEVDFLARRAGAKDQLIQVSADPSDAATATREIQGLVEAGRLFPKAERRLLTSTRDAIPAGMPKGILAQPAYEWMLEGAAKVRGRLA
jgi:predicted AAA+ superfamily ATPase